MSTINQVYSNTHAKITSDSSRLNTRLFNTYNNIERMRGINVDLGCGDRVFSKVCQSSGIQSYAYDYSDINLETDSIPHADRTIGTVTLNAVIEHIANPNNLMTEIYRILQPYGVVYIRTPNWNLDYRNFYNDITHVKPYTPESLTTLLKTFGFQVGHCEPGLIMTSGMIFELPDSIKWQIASWLPKGTKSIIAVGIKC